MRTMLMTTGVALAAGMATAAQDTYEVKPLRLVFPMRPEAQGDSTGCCIVLS